MSRSNPISRSIGQAAAWYSKAPLGRSLHILGVVIAIVGVSLAIYHLSTMRSAQSFSPQFRRPSRYQIKQGIWGAEEASQAGLSKEWSAYVANNQKAFLGYVASVFGAGLGGVFVIGLGLEAEERVMKKQWKEVQEMMEARNQ